MSATHNSNASDTRTGISARRITSTAPTTINAKVWPRPQQTPRNAAFELLRSPVTSVDTAAR